MELDMLVGRGARISGEEGMAIGSRLTRTKSWPILRRLELPADES
jgi:hypothetical protein